MELNGKKGAWLDATSSPRPVRLLIGQTRWDNAATIHVRKDKNAVLATVLNGVNPAANNGPCRSGMTIVRFALFEINLHDIACPDQFSLRRFRDAKIPDADDETCK
jgi:hypothetical protein